MTCLISGLEPRALKPEIRESTPYSINIGTYSISVSKLQSERCLFFLWVLKVVTNEQCCGSGMIYFGSDPGSGSGFSESSGSDPGSGSGSYSGSGSCINLYESAYLYMHMYTHTHTYTHILTTVYM